jgi:hypothetical protein
LSEDRASASINSAIFVRRFRSFAFIGVYSLLCAAYQQQIRNKRHYSNDPPSQLRRVRCPKLIRRTVQITPLNGLLGIVAGMALSPGGF